MRIDFNEIASMTFPGMDNGTGMMSAHSDPSGRKHRDSIHDCLGNQAPHFCKQFCL